MNYSEKLFEEQEAIRLENTIDSFFSDFQVGRLLNGAGIRKMRGASPLKIFAAIFRLPFEGKNFYRGIVERHDLGFGKDAAYALLRNPRHNWRRLMLGLAVKIATVFSLLANEGREKALIFDSSTYDRSRSKKVELLAWVFDHTIGKSLRGFSMLTLGWSDGFSFIPLDFVLGSSANKKSRLQEAEKPIDKRTCGHKRRLEAVYKTTDLLETMLKRVLAAGIDADYVLMDSWFSFPAVIATLSRHCPVICMLKNMHRVFYCYEGQWYTLGRLYGRLKKRPGRARILASVIVETRQGQRVRIVFVRHRHKRDWLPVLSTEVDLPDEEIIRIYGKRWDIEVCFKMLKQHLRLEKEAQLRDYDGLVGHATVVMIRYMFLSFRQRLYSDQRTAGSLFHACCEEVRDLTLLEAMQRLMSLVVANIRSTGEFAEDAISKMIDAMMGAAAEFMETISRTHDNKYGIAIS
ncbi:MAG: transposase [Deltaproteobacteria bacterium]|jgi:hypothetical protein